MVELQGAGENADWNKELQALVPVFEGVRPDASWAARDTVRQTAKKVIQKLDADLADLKGAADFIFSTKSEAQDLARQVTDMLRRWQLSDNAPSLTALSIFAIENLQPNLPPEVRRAVLVGSVIGEVENKLPYHNNTHYKKVLLQVMRLVAVHNSIYEDTLQAFDGRQVGLLLLAACIHDLGHDGKGNTIKGVFEQGRLEKRAYELALPYLEVSQMSLKDMENIRVILMCTDVAPLGDPANPLNQMKSAYRYHFLGQKKKLGPLNLDEDLSALEKDPALTMMAIILHEADIGTSAGLDYAVTSYETSIYKKEMGQAEAFPEDVTDFLDDICQRQMISDAAQRLFAANMARIYALAEKEIADGNHAFPQPEHSEFLLIPHGTASTRTSKTIN